MKALSFGTPSPSPNHRTAVTRNHQLLDPARPETKTTFCVQGVMAPLPPEHVWVYDEAQRAWDAEMVGEKHRYQMSEPEMFIKLGERMPGWFVMVGLIGSGQEIFRGEEQGVTWPPLYKYIMPLLRRREIEVRGVAMQSPTRRSSRRRRQRHSGRHAA